MDADGSSLALPVLEGSDRELQHPDYFESCWKDVDFIDTRAWLLNVYRQSVGALRMVSRNKLYTYKVE